MRFLEKTQVTEILAGAAIGMAAFMTVKGAERIIHRIEINKLRQANPALRSLGKEIKNVEIQARLRKVYKA